MIWSGFGLALVLTGILLPHTLGVGEWRYAFLVAAVVGVAITTGLWRAAGRGGTAISQGNVAAGDVAAAGDDALFWFPLFAAYFMFGVAYLRAICGRRSSSAAPT